MGNLLVAESGFDLERTHQVMAGCGEEFELIVLRAPADALSGLFRAAGLLRPAALVRMCRELVKRAQAEWPALLADAPGNVRAMVTQRLAGGVALTAHA